MSAVLAVWVDGIRAAEIGAGAEPGLGMGAGLGAGADSGAGEGAGAAQSAGFWFRYTPAWLDHPQRYPFSPHLPLGARSSGAEVKNFFSNLLPEGSALEVAASMHKLNRHDAFGLLARIGREAAGALAILPDGMPFDSAAALRPLGREELSERIREREWIPFASWDGKIRLSIAGHQDKLAVHIDSAGQMFLPDGGASSTHIVKPDNANPKLPFMPANEHFCMRLAAALKMPVPGVALLRLPEALYQIERFDRKRLPGSPPAVRRLHQIDLCQILNLPVEMKYQQAHEYDPVGASLQDLFRAAGSTSQPANTRMALLRWIVFNYLIGNTDAHAKNLSFFLDRDGLRLAPFYDLVSGAVYGLRDMALFIGNEEEINLVSATEWGQMCRLIELPQALLASELATQVRGWRRVGPGLLGDPVYTDGERVFLKGLAEEIDERAELMSKACPYLRKGI